MSPATPEPVFRGIHRLLTVIEGLCHRKSFWYRGHKDDVRGETPLPLLCVIREQADAEFLQTLAGKLDAVRARAIPHAYVDAGGSPANPDEGNDSEADDGEPLLPLLNRVRSALIHSGYGGRELTNFHRYRLADWLTRQRIPRDARRDESVGIKRLLRKWISKRGYRSMLDPEASGSNIWIWILLHVVPPLSFWIWRRSREVRWFMSQEYMTAHARDSLSLAQSLTIGHRNEVNTEEIKRLLVHAFLEDLRSSYRRRLLPFRSRQWRRTAHTVVLLDNITESNGGWELLQLINDVRNDTGDPDPLLLVAASSNTPRRLTDGGLQLVPADEADNALERWQEELPRQRQKANPLARYLAISIPDGTAGKRRPLREDHYAWYKAKFEPQKPALLARRFVLSSLVFLAGVSLINLSGFAFIPEYQSACYPFGRGEAAIPDVEEALSLKDANIEVEAIPVKGRWECVGYSDNSSQRFGNNEQLLAVQDLIFKANNQAKQKVQGDTGKLLVSIVYFAGLTQPQADAASYSALSEELEGLLVLQRELIDSDSSHQLRVIIANGGTEMKAAPHVAEHMIIPLTRNDLSVIGVVGMDRTTTDTENAISLLGRRGIPTIATSLTGTGLSKKSPLYFQLVPGNKKQAQLIKGYLDRRGGEVSKMTIYHPKDRNDTYVNTLVNELKAEFNKSVQKDTKLRAAARVWQPGHPYQVEPRCDSGDGSTKEIAFYAGRPSDFSGFLQNMIYECGRMRLPEIIGDDATTRFFAEAGIRSQPHFIDIPVSYVAMGASLALKGKRCLNPPTEGLVAKANQKVNVFCAGYRKLQAELQTKFDTEVVNPFVSGRSGLSYDGARFLLEAVQRLNTQFPTDDGKATVPSLPGLALALKDREYNGVTGTLSFQDKQVADRQTMAILRFDNIRSVDSQPVCRRAFGDFQVETQPETGCPRT